MSSLFLVSALENVENSAVINNLKAGMLAELFGAPVTIRCDAGQIGTPGALDWVKETEYST
jgi:hypothetical protein